MASTSDAGTELNIEEFSNMSKRLPERKRERWDEVSWVCQHFLAALFVLVFIALAQVNGQPPPALAYIHAFFLSIIFLSLSLHQTHK